jgi:hypothetical protein
VTSKLCYCSYKDINQLNTTTTTTTTTQQKIKQFQWILSHVNIGGNEWIDEIAKIATTLQPTLQPVMSLKVNISALNKTIAQNWKNEVSNSSVGNSYKLNAKHIDLSMYNNIPRALQTFGARATLGHIITILFIQIWTQPDSYVQVMSTTGRNSTTHL